MKGNMKQGLSVLSVYILALVGFWAIAEHKEVVRTRINERYMRTEMARMSMPPSVTLVDTSYWTDRAEYDCRSAAICVDPKEARIAGVLMDTPITSVYNCYFDRDIWRFEIGDNGAPCLINGVPWEAFIRKHRKE